MGHKTVPELEECYQENEAHERSSLHTQASQALLVSLHTQASQTLLVSLHTQASQALLVSRHTPPLRPDSQPPHSSQPSPASQPLHSSQSSPASDIKTGFNCAATTEGRYARKREERSGNEISCVVYTLLPHCSLYQFHPISWFSRALWG